MADSMDVDDNISNALHYGGALTDFATGEVIHSSTNKSTWKDLRTVLTDNGLSQYDAEQLSQAAFRFLPLQLKSGLILYACKNCGKMHGQKDRCADSGVSRWFKSLHTTGWEAAFKAWVKERRGWRLNTDTTTWDLTKMAKLRRDALGDSVQTSLITDYFKPAEAESKLMLVSDQGSEDVDMITNSSLHSNKMPIWQTVPRTNGNGQKSKAKTSEIKKQQTQHRSEAREAQREAQREAKKVEYLQRVEKSKLKKAKRELQYREQEHRYLQLHNDLNSNKMTMEDVQLKFKRKRYVLDSAIQSLEREKYDSLTDCFAKVEVKESTT